MRKLKPLRAVLRLFWSSDRQMLVYGVALSLLTALAGIALLGLSGWFLAATAAAGVTIATALAFDVFMPSAGIRLLALGRTGARYGERVLTHDATLRILARLRETIFRAYALPQGARVLAAHPSRLLFRLTMDIDALDSLYLRVIAPVLVAIGSALVVTAALALIHPLVGFAAGLILVGSGIGIPLIASRAAEGSARRRAHALEALRSRSIDLVRGQEDLLMAGRLDAQLERIADADRMLSRTDTTLNRIETNVSFGLGLTGAALLAGMLVAVAMLAEAGEIGAPIAALALLVTLGALESFAALRRGAVEFGRTRLAARRLAPRFDAPTEICPLAEPQAGFAAVLNDASVQHDASSAPALYRTSLTIGAGERVALVGASGAGKSSLLGLIAGELAPATGTIAAVECGQLTQRTELFRDSLRGNLALAYPQASDADMLAALHDAGLGALLADLPNGLDNWLGEGGAGLSAGQARRLALARLFLRDSPLWLLDEPTEGIDGDTARDVLNRIRQRAADRTLLIATHCRREAELADRIIVLQAGRVVADVTCGQPEYRQILSELRPD